MDPERRARDLDDELLDLICEGIAAGALPLADETDLAALLRWLDVLRAPAVAVLRLRRPAGGWQRDRSAREEPARGAGRPLARLSGAAPGRRSAGGARSPAAAGAAGEEIAAKTA